MNRRAPSSAASDTRSPAYYVARLDRASFAPRYWPSWVAAGLLWLCARFPMSVGRAMGAALGLLMGLANAKRRRIARINLALCFPELSARARRRLFIRHFVVSGQSLVDLGYLAWASTEWIQRKVRIRGLATLRAQLEAGRRVILLVPHCVGVNFGGAVLARHHAAFSIFKPQPDPAVTWLLNKGRTRFGARLLARAQGLRPVVRGLEQGMMLYYLPDEDLGRRDSVFAPFFGVPAARLPTLARLARLTDAVVVPCCSRLLPRAEGYEVTLLPPLEGFPSGDAVRDVAQMNRAVEECIRRAPEQYLWTFKIFRTRPSGESDFYER